MRARWMAIIGITGAVLTGSWYRGEPSSPPLNWPTMAQSFESEKFMRITISEKREADAEVEETELWLTHDGRARMREGAEIIFARAGEVSAAFDLKTRQPVAVSEASKARLAGMTSRRKVAFDEVLSAIYGESEMESASIVDAYETASPGKLSFHLQAPNAPRSMYVWLDCVSRRPSRMWFGNPRTGVFVEAIFSYPKDIHDRFFDPSVFSRTEGADPTAREASANDQSQIIVCPATNR